MAVSHQQFVRSPIDGAGERNRFTVRGDVCPHVFYSLLGGMLQDPRDRLKGLMLYGLDVSDGEASRQHEDRLCRSHATLQFHDIARHCASDNEDRTRQAQANCKVQIIPVTVCSRPA